MHHLALFGVEGHAPCVRPGAQVPECLLQLVPVLCRGDEVANFGVVSKLLDHFDLLHHQVNVIDENQEKQGAKHTALWYPRQYLNPGGELAIQHNSLGPASQPGRDPGPYSASYTMSMYILQQPLPWDLVECFSKVQENHIQRLPFINCFCCLLQEF